MRTLLELVMSKSKSGVEIVEVCDQNGNLEHIFIVYTSA